MFKSLGRKLVLDKMLKQRRDAAAQYDDAGRGELADKERSEMVIIEEFMPAALSEDDLDALIRETINATGASGMQDMGNVMNELKPLADRMGIDLADQCSNV